MPEKPRFDKPSNYFEGILQLRDVNRETFDFVESECAGQFSKISEVKGGYDFYMRSNPFLLAFGKKLVKKCSGEIKVTASLHTKDKNTSKDLYRVTVLFRGAEFSKGDKIELQGEIFEIVGVSKKVILKGNGKKLNTTFEDLRKKKARKVS